MKKVIFLFTLLVSGFSASIPLPIDPTNPPSMQQISEEQGRLNGLNIRVDSFLKSEAGLNKAADLSKNEIMPAINALVAKVETWQNELSLLKVFISNIHDLSIEQQDQFRNKFNGLLADLYDIQVERSEVVSDIQRMQQYISIVPDINPDLIVQSEVTSYSDNNKDVFKNYIVYKGELKLSVDNFNRILSEEYYNNMEVALRNTIDIIDNVLVIRSLDYPELANDLERLKNFTRFNEYLQPKLAEFQNEKSKVSDAVLKKQVFRAVKNISGMRLKLQEVKTGLQSIGFSSDEKQNIENILANEISEAERILPVENVRSSIIASRFNAVIREVKPICLDESDALRYRFNCSGLIPLLNITENIAELEDFKLKYIEKQIDYVLRERD